jgi:CRP/FNR family transcriptional regulator
LASRGDWVGHRSIFTSEVYRGSAQAKEGTRVFFASTAVLFRFFEANKNFAHQLIRLIAHDLEAAESRLAERRELSVPTRLISLFRRLDGKFGEPAEGGRLIKTKLSKVELAQMVGASQEVVSRQISKWKKARLLHESGKQFHLSDKLLNRIIRD